jgi:hypothetical protein
METLGELKKAIKILEKRITLLGISKRNALMKNNFTKANEIDKIITKYDSMIIDFKFRMANKKGW